MQNEFTAPTCYCTALRRTTRRVTALYDGALAPIGIGVAQLGVLRAIDRAGVPTITELGRELGLDRSTAGRNVRVLARMALLLLDRDGGDQRESTVTLTGAGRDVLARAQPLWAGAQKTVADRLGAGAADRLLAALSGL